MVTDFKKECFLFDYKLYGGMSFLEYLFNSKTTSGIPRYIPRLGVITDNQSPKTCKLKFIYEIS